MGLSGNLIFMSAINFYKCNNQECDFAFSLSVNFPIWKKDTPESEQMLPANPDYVLETVSDSLCVKCKKVVSIEENTYVCPSCGEKDTFLEEGDTCPKCHTGIVLCDETATARF